MALDRLTKVDGGGISTTSDYRVGVITASKFVGPIDGVVTGSLTGTATTAVNAQGLTGTPDIVVGILTASSANFSGNVTIGGTLTYEDVTNIDSVGVITARNGIKVSTGTATTALVVDGDARVTGILTVGTSSLKLDGPNNLVNVGTALTLGHSQGVQFHTQNLHSQGFEVNQINASGIITATSADINGDLDVDGHTNLDNLSIAGVTTTSDNIIIPDDKKLILGTQSGRQLHLYHNMVGSSNHVIESTSSSNHLIIKASVINPRSDYFSFRNLAHNQNVFIIDSDGSTKLYFNGNEKLTTENTGVNITGVCTATSFNGDGSALTGITQTTINNNTNNYVVTATGTANTLNGESTLTYNGNRLFAPSISATDNGAGSPLLSLRQDDQNPWAFEIGNDTYGTGTNGLMGYVENGGDMLIRYRGDSAYKSLTIEQHNGSSNRSWMTLGNGGNVNLYYQGTKRVATNSAGVFFSSDANLGRIILGDTSSNYGWQLAGYDSASSTGGRLVEQDANGGMVLDKRASGTNIFCYNTIKMNGNASADNLKLIMGAGEDLQLYHNGSHSVISNSTGTLFTLADSVSFKNAANNEVLFYANANNEFAAYYDNSKKIETTSAGITVTGTVDSASDVILKENIKTIDNALDKVTKLRGVEYDYKENKKHSIGVIAQEVEEVLPELVNGSEQKSVAYGNIAAVLIEAIKEQNEVINKMKKEIEDLKG